MYNKPRKYPFLNPQIYNMFPYCFWGAPPMIYPPLYFPNMPMYNSNYNRPTLTLKDYGDDPFVINIDDAAEQNNTFRTALWTGDNLQVTLMSIDVGEDIGLEVHTNGDQFIRIEEGDALVRMGDSPDNLDYQRQVSDDYAIIIPVNKWHNIINIGDKPLKLYAIYAPPEHPFGTVHDTKQDAENEELNNRYY